MPPSEEDAGATADASAADDARRSAREAFLRRMEAQQRESQRKLQTEEVGQGEVEGPKKPPAAAVEESKATKSSEVVPASAGGAKAAAATIPKAEEIGASTTERKESSASSQEAWIPISSGAKKTEAAAPKVVAAASAPIKPENVEKEEDEEERKAEEFPGDWPDTYPPGGAIFDDDGMFVDDGEDDDESSEDESESSEENEDAAAAPSKEVPADELEGRKTPPLPSTETMKESEDDARVRAYLATAGIVPESLVAGPVGVGVAPSLKLEDIFDGSSLDVLRAVAAETGGGAAALATAAVEEGKAPPPPALVSEGGKQDAESSAPRSLASSAAAAPRSIGAASSTEAGSVVPPLSVVRATGANGGRPDYGRVASELTLPPSLAPPPPEAANLGFAGLGAQSYRTDATTAGSAAAAQPIEEEEDLDLAALEPWQRVMLRRMERQDAAVREVMVRLDGLTELVRYQQAQMMNQQQQGMAGQGGMTGRGQQMQFQQPPAAQVGYQYLGRINATPPPPPQPRVSFNEPPGAQPRAAGAAGSPGQPQPGVHPRAAAPPAQPREAPHFVVLPLLQSLLSAFFYVPRTAATYLASTRPIRFVRLLTKEAVQRNVLRDFDMGLLFKMVFISAIMSSRGGGGGGGRKKRGDDEGFDILAMWERHRAYVFLLVAAVVFVVQVGWAKFIYDVVVKENLVGKVWRDEDLKEEEEARRREEVAAAGGDGTVGEGGEAAGQRAQGAEGAANADGGRRGQQDRGAAAGAGAAAADGAAPRPPAAAGAPARPPRRGARERPGGQREEEEERRNNFFLDGGVVRRRPRAVGVAAGAVPIAGQQRRNAGEAQVGGPAQGAAHAGGEGAVAEAAVEVAAVEGGVLAFFNDIRYLLGSFVLSLLPMWHPREVVPRRIPPPAAARVEEAAPRAEEAERGRGQGDGQPQRGVDDDENGGNGNGAGN